MRIEIGRTGPRTDQSIERWLAATGRVELLNVLLLSALVWSLAQPLGFLSILGLVTLVLVQGGLYWLLKRRQLRQRRPGVLPLRVLRVTYPLNGLLLLAFPLGLLGAALGVGPPLQSHDLLWGAALFAFGCAEFVHYFVCKINMRPSELRKAWRHKRPVPSRFRRELDAAQRRALGRSTTPDANVRPIGGDPA